MSKLFCLSGVLLQNIMSTEYNIIYRRPILRPDYTTSMTVLLHYMHSMKKEKDKMELRGSISFLLKSLQQTELKR